MHSCELTDLLLSTLTHTCGLQRPGLILVLGRWILFLLPIHSHTSSLTNQSILSTANREGKNICVCVRACMCCVYTYVCVLCVYVCVCLCMVGCLNMDG